MKAIISFILAAALCAGCNQPADDHEGHDHSGHDHKAPSAPVVGIPPDQREPNRLWCKEHNRYEDRCWLCHPELQDKNRIYCDEHGLYEDECFLCDLKLKPGARNTDRLMCQEHGVFEDECGICHSELTGKLKPGEGLK